VITALVSARTALANEDSLLRMRSTSRISLGSSDHAVPTSFVDATGTHVGYHMDVCNRIVQAIRQRFDMPALKITTVATTLATRFAMLNNGTIDIDCGHNAITGAGLQQALFAHATLISDLKAVTIAENRGQSLASFDGRTVAVVVGDTAIPLLRAAARKSQAKVIEAITRDAAAAFSLLAAGRADLVILPEAIMIAQRNRTKDPSRFVFVEGSLRTEPVAVMVRLSDEKLLDVANEVIDAMMRTGEMERLYRKWYVDPVPGLGEGLNLPPSPKLRALFANPGSEMLDF